MVKKLWAFAVDFWRDGNALLGAVAAPLSIAFTLAKAFDVPALSHLRDISYAWALAPLLIWVLVAYVRLHARTSKSARKQDLQDFYVSVGPIITRQLPRDISESDFNTRTRRTYGLTHARVILIKKWASLRARDFWTELAWRRHHIPGP